MPCILKSGADKMEFEAKIQQLHILWVQNEVLVADKAHPLCLLVVGDLWGNLGRAENQSQWSQNAQAHVMYP